MVSLLSSSIQTTHCIDVPVQLTFQGNILSTKAMLDSGAAGNFIDENLVKMTNTVQLSFGSGSAIHTPPRDRSHTAHLHRTHSASWSTTH